MGRGKGGGAAPQLSAVGPMQESSRASPNDTGDYFRLQALLDGVLKSVPRHPHFCSKGMPVLIVALLSVFVVASKGVQITRLSMPRWVQNGTEDSVVLDCEYNYSEEDDRRLVVKWFLNDDPLPIYQWIPELNQRYASERVRGKLNMDYSVHPSSKHTRYRALNLMKPTTELSGRYACHVVSYLGQDVEDQVMVVYAPPRTFDFNYTKISPSAANFSCEADGVFPQPEITLLRTGPTTEADEVPCEQTVTQAQNGGAFRVQVTRTVRDWELSERASIFECVLRIPGTDYENMRRVLYLPGSISGTWRPRQERLLLLILFCLLFLICS